MYKAKVAQYKVDEVQKLVKLINSYPLVGIVNMENIPAPQLAKMRGQLRSSLFICMSKKRMINFALKEADKSKKGIGQLEKYSGGMPALVFTKENPFKIASILRKSRTSAPAKPGQTSPRDIVIPAGPTPFAPGPIISDLGGVGLKTGVEGGKVTIRQDHLIVKEGEKISQKVSDVLTKLGIQPMEIGLDIVAIFEQGVIYTRDVLSVDEKQYLDNVVLAAATAMGLSVHIGYPTKDNIKRIIAKAFNDAKGLAISKEIISDAYIHKVVVDAQRAANSIGSKVPQE